MPELLNANYKDFLEHYKYFKLRFSFILWIYQ
jgi:hypothetical protein